MANSGVTTIRDVAALAQVSLTTVSHALNGTGRVSEATRLRVHEAARTLGYSANIHARGLAGRPAGLVAIQVSGYGRETFLPAAAYYLELINGASAAALEAGIALIATPGSADRGSLARLPVDGAILVDPQGDEPILDIMRDRGAPVVTTGRPLLGKHQCGVVDNDHAGATVKALEHLRRSGYERPALITSARRLSYAEDAIAAYRTWTAKRGSDEFVTRLANVSVGAAESTAKKLLKSRRAPDSFFVTTDDLAVGVALAAQSSRYDIPASIGLISLGDSPALRSLTPPISAIDIMPHRIGIESVEVLLRRLSGATSDPEHRLVPTRLVARTSTLRPRR